VLLQAEAPGLNIETRGPSRNFGVQFLEHYEASGYVSKNHQYIRVARSLPVPTPLKNPNLIFNTTLGASPIAYGCACLSYSTNRLLPELPRKCFYTGGGQHSTEKTQPN